MVIIFQMFLWVTGSLSGPGNTDTIVDSEKRGRDIISSHFYLQVILKN